ncbi:MAG: FAD-dependent oxidoreductase [Acidobacteriota bacterium]
MNRSTPYFAVIIGSGFAGSILARVLRRLKKRVVVVEKSRHPRFALGESTTPIGGLALERLAARYRLDDLRHMAAYGRWLDDLPHLRRGLKRGFTFFHHQNGEPYANGPDNDHRLMVAASPDDRLADTHWLRSDVDHHLAKRAVAEGARLLQETTVEDVEVTEGGVRVRIRSDQGVDFLESRYVIDASGGGHSVLARAFDLPSKTDRVPIDTSLLFCHMDGVRHLRDSVPDPHPELAPYPEERAAVHHLLDIGWLYVLRFDHGPASVGLVLRKDRLPISQEQLEVRPGRALRRLLDRYPSLGEIFRDARPVDGVVGYKARLQHRYSSAAGKRFFLLPSAYAFYDPLFSTGIAWNLLAVERLASLFEGRYGDARDYALLLSQEADQLESLIESCYLSMDNFDRFVGVTELYFAGVSFAEAQQRLMPMRDGRPDAWDGFLGARDPVMSSLVVQTRDRLRRDAKGLASASNLLPWLRQRLSSRDIIGLDQAPTPRLYPVDLDVLQERSDRLGLSPEEVFAALPRLRGEA